MIVIKIDVLHGKRLNRDPKYGQADFVLLCLTVTHHLELGWPFM